MRKAKKNAEIFETDTFSDSPLYEETYRVKERRDNVRFFALLFSAVFVVLACRWVFVSHFARIDVDGVSMYPTLRDEDVLLMRYGAEAERGDVIIVDVRKYEFENDVQFLVKRLIGVEGDRIKEEDGKILISTAAARERGDEEYRTLFSQPQNVQYSLGGYEYEVGEGEIFFLGDNAKNSKDSRFKQGASYCHLTCLYKAADIYGVVPQWAIEHKGLSAFLARLSDGT